MVEYALLVVLIAIVALVAVRLAGTEVSGDLQRDRLRPQPKSQRLEEKGPGSAGPFFISAQVFGGVRRYFRCKSKYADPRRGFMLALWTKVTELDSGREGRLDG